MPERLQREDAGFVPGASASRPGPLEAQPSRVRPRRPLKEHARLIAAVFLGALAAIFAVLNIDEVEVNWILGTWSTPLIAVIAVSFLLGVGADRLLRARRGPRSRRR